MLLSRAVIVIGIGIAASWGNAQQLRIESQVFVSGKPAAVASSLTLIDSTAAYDFSLDPGHPERELEIAIYDFGQRNVVLLDCARSVMLSLEQYELLKMVEEQRLQVNQQADLAFLISPDFEEDLDLPNNQIELRSPGIRYLAQCEKPRDATAMPYYFEALDQFTRLASSDPSRLPPFPRLALNQVLRRYSLIPREIEFQLNGGTVLPQDLKLRSTHTVVWQISDVDRQRIESAKSKWMTYTEVSLGKYRELSRANSAVRASGVEKSETETSLKR